ncbi:MAG: hypothetical protein RDU20_21160 [Desulfomonilaceae bacterium]|nr:hypothetical protein [Desulfomonilaceae bacterium]
MNLSDRDKQIIKDRVIRLCSNEPGRYKIAVKVIDIFGNDTTKVVEVKV